jgi:predicted ribosomally synthesized peptide with nif11-like leader
MSEEQLKAFLEAVKADAALQKKVEAAADNDAVVAIAKEAGFVITAEAFKNDYVSDGDLEEISGGYQTSQWYTGCC